eukprot:CAMPEP_0172872406 /NCGR_PEP_ID=MMETSP1075-20121228/92619_1 /TAXON_ID=2916 /ORGANISM="Ceratium fusus, Strain PA161109" /LENGTH=122 /DNA_ID=CAMNT_0013722731 /DNA_START=174 /DNA_END=542 /DNA_ORIENTATION=-
MTREQMLRKVFEETDQDKSGYISLDEHKNLLTRRDDPIANAVLQESFEMSDKGGWFGRKDGQLSMHEFVEFNLDVGKRLSDEEFRIQASQWMRLATERHCAATPTEYTAPAPIPPTAPTAPT